ncbi:hypothetical protein GIW41_15065 [Pseudomonas sp. PA-6-1D]|uniref:hypothetical protein n=1 Tax=Pseudomonas TaxID=286 RepID=UPI001EF04E0D|nr:MULTISPECIES: hypothetical protein [Pseudomonas]MCF5139990.1 hypothetical protein [Pseudomonas sp. PA-6-3C]MCF5146170.1 hypothetical protein [Pseudomonas sp. PA-6-3F]MCF5156832.1 hypothetical protein [Pseudomonas sp. PA-6-2E]MCF5176578.1 hypothetical protein [Pseudomonas sp. PA-6-1D]MCF5190670.1 hypothetical protein [Pseudomonas sp. PA-6-1H]
MNRGFYRADKRLPLSLSYSLRPGLVKVCGTVMLKESRLSPVDGLPCAGYSLQIQESYRDSGERDAWRTVFTDAQCNDFALKDAHGTVDIIAEGIELFSGQVPQLGDYRYTAGPGRQQGEILLSESLEVMVIGTAIQRNGKTVIVRGEEADTVFGVERLRTVNNYRLAVPAWRALGLCSALVVLFSMALLLIDPAQWMQWQLPSRDTFQQMAGLGPFHEWVALLYQRQGLSLPLLAAFGWMGIVFVLMCVARVFLYRDIHKRVQPILIAWGVVGVIGGGLVTWALVALEFDPFKILLIWLSVIIVALIFSTTQIRALQALVASVFKTELT